MLIEALNERHEVAVSVNTCERLADARWKFRKAGSLRWNALLSALVFSWGLASLLRKLRGVVYSQGHCCGRKAQAGKRL